MFVNDFVLEAIPDKYNLFLIFYHFIHLSKPLTWSVVGREEGADQTIVFFRPSQKFIWTLNPNFWKAFVVLSKIRSGRIQ